MGGLSDCEVGGNWEDAFGYDISGGGGWFCTQEAGANGATIECLLLMSRKGQESDWESLLFEEVSDCFKQFLFVESAWRNLSNEQQQLAPNRSKYFYVRCALPVVDGTLKGLLAISDALIEKHITKDNKDDNLYSLLCDLIMVGDEKVRITLCTLLRKLAS